MSTEVHRHVVEKYLTFADQEARGVSALYESLSRRVAETPELVDLISNLPSPKQQPNLVFAAYRTTCGVPVSADEFARQLVDHWPAIASIALARATQTNEPGRCATLLPVLASLPQPLALLEVGASAGLCLFPDCYAYRYGELTIEPDPRFREPPVFECAVDSNVPLPSQPIEVVWRRGIDLNPLPVDDADAMDWLRTLIWPEHVGRASNFDRALAVARAEQCDLRQGNACEDLARFVDDVPQGATLVVFHSAVLAYVIRPERQRFVDAVQRLDAVWIANEHPRVFPIIAAKSPVTPPEDKFLLSVDGEPVGFTGPHGQSLDWIS